MRIARVVLFVLAIVGGVGFLLAADRLWTAHAQVKSDLRSAALANAKSDWYQGTVALSFERSVTQVAMALDQPVPRDFRDLIDQQRAQSDALLDLATAEVASVNGFENGEKFSAEVEAARNGIRALRQEADALLSLPRDQRDPVRSVKLPYELKAQIEALFGTATLLVLADGSYSTVEAMLNQIQTLAWDIREYGGRARTFYAIASLTGAPIPLERAGEAAIDTARAKTGWAKIQTATEAVTLPPALLSALAAVEEPFAVTYLRSLDRMDAAMADMRAGQTVEMPYTFEEFFGLSNAGLDAIAGIAPLAGDHIQEYWSEALQASRMSRAINAGVIFFVIFLTIGSVFAMRKKMIRPLEAATGVLQNIAAGDLSREFRQTPRGLDEVKVIWDALEALTYKLRAARDKAEQDKEAEQRAKEGLFGEMMVAFEKLSKGDLTHLIKDEYGDAYSELVENFNKTCATLRGVVEDVVANSQQIGQMTTDLSKAIESLSSRTDRQTGMVANTAQNLSDLSEQVTKTADNTKRSTQTVSEAVAKSDSGRQVVESAMVTMETIRVKSEEIHGISMVIDEIAFQTGLLALNAGVEAARAGSAGEGFAVVASEVRTLASQAAEAAQKVKVSVTTSEESVRSGVNEVAKTGDSLKEITSMVEEAKGHIRDIEDASHIQSTTLSEIGETMDEINSVTRQNAEMVERVTATSDTLRKKSQELQSAVGIFVVAAKPAAQQALKQAS